MPKRPSIVTPSSSMPTPAGRASACCGAAPKASSGMRSAMRRPCSPSSRPRSRRPRRGRLAMARALLAQGDRAGAQHYVRETWRQDSMSADLEAQVLESFGELISRADHKARMDRQAVRRGYRRRDARGAAARRQRPGDRAGARGGDQQGRQCRRAARSRAERGAYRRRLHLQPGAMDRVATTASAKPRS